MYICICKAITDNQIRRAKAAGITNLHDLRETLGVASGCGSCADDAEMILREADGRGGAPQPRLYIPSAA